MSILYKYKAAYKEMYPLLEALKAKGHTLLFVFDGKPPAEKEEEVKERREARQDAATKAVTLKDQLTSAELTPRERQILEYSIARLEFQGWHMTRDIRHEVQQELWARGIPYVKGLSEADQVLVDLVGGGKLDVVVSTDMDFLLSSVPQLWIPFRKHQDGFERIELREVLESQAITDEQFRDAGILCGVEPLRGKVAVPPQVAFGWIYHYGSIEAILKSSIKDSSVEALRAEPALVESTRQHFAPRAPWDARIRPDHLERFRDFLAVL
jgi:flap endonuclease-1